MKILLIITPFYPSQTPNTLRWMPIIKYYAQNGIQTTILTTKNRLPKTSDELNGYEVIKTGYNTLLDWFYFTFKVKHRRQLPKNESGINKPKSGNKFLQKFSTTLEYKDKNLSLVYLNE